MSTVSLSAAVPLRGSKLRAASRREVRATPMHWLTRLLSYWQLIRYT
ncbi:MAG: hypothetical protein RM022_007670 [Nostoc sp. EfeVER01]|nr:MULTISPECIES: hypothetical protein [unclassified Nostoc]MDZ7948918.1 hypothetical protein [Nostoc sp. EfeVER01]MDZ7992430.1 hypothetical protein [Nostoc sp. EspVER01]